MESRNNRFGIILSIIILVLVCIFCVVLVVFVASLVVLEPGWLINLLAMQKAEQPPLDLNIQPTSSHNPGIQSSEEAPDWSKTLHLIANEPVPLSDPNSLAERFAGKKDIPDTFPDIYQPYELGEEKTFWVTDTDANRNFQITAVLRNAGEHHYFWIEKGLIYRVSDLEVISGAFEEDIYPRTTRFFGNEWNPGIDQDPHLYFVYAGGLGNSISGYFSSTDEIHPAAYLYSNAHEMFLINADTVSLGERHILATLAHELQHMIQWHVDRNEDTWLNEGFSMLSEKINGYPPQNFDFLYTEDTNIQLTDWLGSTEENSPHYGASYLFMTYFLDRFGEEAMQDLIMHEANGMASVDAILKAYQFINPSTGKVYTSTELFADWAVTNSIQDAAVENGRYAYTSLAPTKADRFDTIAGCRYNGTLNVSQFGVRYLQVNCKDEFNLSFEGLQTVKLLPFEMDQPGNLFFWPNMSEEGDAFLEQEFDFSGVSGSIEMSFKAWYDIEDGFDYLYLSASENGSDWEILETSSCSLEDPVGQSYGCGYTGQSNGWVDEQINLAAYAGKTVRLRFDYITDSSVYNTGFALDDVNIDAIDYSANFQNTHGGWSGKGWVRIENTLRQVYNLSVIQLGDEIKVSHIPLNETNQAAVRINNKGYNRVILVISGATPFTRELADFTISLK